jgi:3-(3-hydroxy-phenyl)propionate hydroxylase
MKKHYSVVIVGAGPTGLTLANLLGAQGIDVLLLERKSTTVDEPRAVSIDDESLRTMQAAGLVGEVLSNTVHGYGSYYHSAGGTCFAKVEPTGTPYGYPRRNAFRQPILEGQLRLGLVRFGNVTASFGWRLDSFSQSAERAWLTAIGPDDALARIECDYLIGCDGAASSVRRGLGIGLEGTSFNERWLIVDLENFENLSRHTKVFCDPKRPCITLPGPNNTRRYEFKLHAYERDEDLSNPTMVHRLLRDHDGDPLATIRRVAVYGFHARVTARWRVGRVFLAGDAAHLTPPFAGQGMNSGIRDAHNLAWKVAAVVRGTIGASLLDSYESERKNHVKKMIDLALMLGRVMSPPNRFAALATQTFYHLLKLCPPARDYIVQMKYKPAPKFQTGFLVPDRKRATLVGRLFPQPAIAMSDGATTLLDEAIGNRFALLAYTKNPAAAFAGFTQDVWKDLGAIRIAIVPPGHGIESVPGVTVVGAKDNAFRRTFAPYRDHVLLLRPDHYVAASIPLSDVDGGARTVAALLAATRKETDQHSYQRHIAA